MKIIAEFKNAERIWLADSERMIFGVDGKFIDCNNAEYSLDLPYGKTVTGETSIIDYDSEEYREAEERRRIEEECSGLESFSDCEVEYEIDDVFGNFGFKDQNGNVVIRPQYAYASEFHLGLCPVNLNRTWYKNEFGDEWYENHFGYINTSGKTVIPFKYDEASIFNKYGLAVVSDDTGCYAIDVDGNEIEGTRDLNLSRYFDFEHRYFSFSSDDDEIDFDGLYDTKERKVFKYPSNDYDYFEYEDNIISVTDHTGDSQTEYYINSNGDILYPLINGNAFTNIRIPDEYGNSVVERRTSIRDEFTSVIDGKEVKDARYKISYLRGMVNKTGKLVVDTEYSALYSIGKGCYVGRKGNISYVFSDDALSALQNTTQSEIKNRDD